MLCLQAIVWCNQLVSLLARMLLSLPTVSDVDAANREAANARLARCTAEETTLRQRMQDLKQSKAPDQPLDSEQQRELRALEGRLEQLGQSQTRGQPALRMHGLTVRHVHRHLVGAETGAGLAW